jgi:hypothetical protein
MMEPDMTETSQSTPTPITSDEEAAQMEQQLAAYRSQQAAERAAQRAEKLKPITDLIASDAWAEFRAAIVRADRDLRDEAFWVHINALNSISAMLPNLVNR